MQRKDGTVEEMKAAIFQKADTCARMSLLTEDKNSAADYEKMFSTLYDLCCFIGIQEEYESYME